MTSIASPSVEVVYAAIDAANAGDPNVVRYDEEDWPRAKFQGVRATYWLARLDPDADSGILFAARAHHLNRWALARASYPEGRAGYHRWKRDARGAARRATATVLASVGVDALTVERVGALVDREGLGSNPGTQLVEDAACLVFLETQYDELIDKLGDEKVAEAVRKTLRKMSPAAIAIAGEAVSSARGLDLLTRVASESSPPTT